MLGLAADEVVTQVEPPALAHHLTLDLDLYDHRVRHVEVLPVEDLPMPGHYRHFELLDQHGETVTLSSLVEAGPVVLFFYPKAMTPG